VIDTRPVDNRPEVHKPGVGDVAALQFSPDGRLLLVYPSVKGRLRAWDVATRRTAEPWAIRPDLNLSGVAFRPDGRVLALGDAIATVEGVFGDERDAPVPLVLWDVTANRPIWTHSPVSPCGMALISENGRRVAVLDGAVLDRKNPPKAVTLFDAATGRPTAAFHSPVGLQGLELTADGRLLACIGMAERAEGGKPIRGGSLFLVDAATGWALAGFVGDDECDIRPVAFSRDGQWLAACGDGVVKVWEVNKISGVGADQRLERSGQQSPTPPSETGNP
jgi:WD40 repeat protein